MDGREFGVDLESGRAMRVQQLVAIDSQPTHNQTAS